MAVAGSDSATGEQRGVDLVVGRIVGQDCAWSLQGSPVANSLKLGCRGTARAVSRREEVNAAAGDVGVLVARNASNS